MKKLLTITLLSLLSISLLAACTDSTAEINEITPTPSAVSTTVTTPAESTQPAPSENEESEYGAVGSFLNDDPTIEQMLIYAIQDEYLARSEYEYIINEMDGATPFTNIITAEVGHIEMLLPLFETYNITLPDDTSVDHLMIPETLFEAYETGVIAEVDNIAMYNLFLELELPDDIRETFVALRDASENHLDAFQRKVDRN